MCGAEQDIKASICQQEQQAVTSNEPVEDLGAGWYLQCVSLYLFLITLQQLWLVQPRHQLWVCHIHLSWIRQLAPLLQ